MKNLFKYEKPPTLDEQKPIIVNKLNNVIVAAVVLWALCSAGIVYKVYTEKSTHKDYSLAYVKPAHRTNREFPNRIPEKVIPFKAPTVVVGPASAIRTVEPVVPAVPVKP